MNASEAEESISIEIPFIMILAVGFGVKLAQLVQLLHSSVGDVGIGTAGEDTGGAAKGTISGRDCSTTSSLSWRFQ